jgi:tRNA dimethylallyltransferase
VRAIEIAAANDEHAPPAPRLLAPLVFGTRWPRPALHDRIGRRLRQRLDAGMIEEVESLIARGVAPKTLRALGLEYRYVTEYLEGTIRNRNDLYQKLRAAIVNFAKRQETWFRRMERRGTIIHWIDEAGASTAIAVVREASRAHA